MKKVLSIALLIWLVVVVRADVIEVTYHFPDYQIERVDDFSMIHIGQTYNSAPEGQPVLPYQLSRIVVPFGHKIDSVVFQGNELRMMDGIHTLIPAQKAAKSFSGDKHTFILNEEVYNSSKPYPKHQYGKISSHLLNGYNLADIAFTPVVYIPKTGKLSVYEHVNLQFYTSPVEGSNNISDNLNTSEDVRSKIAAFVDNPSFMDTYPSSKESEEAYELLIICPSLFQESFTDYRNNYKKRGYRSKVTTTEVIQEELPGDDLQEKIRNYIKYEYQTSQISCVLLAGDAEHIPYRGLYCQVQSQIIVNTYDIPSDIYYSGLDGTWNTNSNSLWGEVGEEDFYPEVLIGRMPCSTQDELQNMINKSLKSQNTPVFDEIEKTLFLGENLQWEPATWGSDFLDLHIGEQQAYDYTTTGIPATFNLLKLYDKQNSWIGQDVINEVNMGRSIIYHNGPSNANYVMKLNSSDINADNFFGANGVDHSFPVIYAQGSDCAAFDLSDCIAEKILALPNFASAFIGNSRFGWYNEGESDGASQHLHREFTNALYGNNLTTIGDAFAESKIQTAPCVSAPGQYQVGAVRYNLYDCNLLGDPLMNIWTTSPMELVVDYAQAVPIGTEEYLVEIHSLNGNTEGLRCAFIQNDTILGVGVTDVDGDATISFTEPLNQLGAAFLYISGGNCQTTKYDVTIIPAEGAYVTLIGYKVDDDMGNANGFTNNGEYIQLNMELQNLGIDNANSVNCVARTNNPYVVLADSTLNCGNLESGESVMVLDAIEFDVLNGIADQSIIEFDLICKDASQEPWYSKIYITVDAPILEPTNDIIVDDYINGNGNGTIDPGELVLLKVNLLNHGHGQAEDIQATLSVDHPEVIIVEPTINMNDLDPMHSDWAVFELLISEDLDKALLLMFDFNAQSTLYSTSLNFGLNVGRNIEDFETNDFKNYDWGLLGNQIWEITDQDPFEGTYCAVSGEIDDDQNSIMQVVLNIVSNDSIEFYRKTSSEMSYDYLRFYIDDQKVGEWSGEQDWNKVVYPVTAGHRSFKWSYEKDYIVSYGQDCAWLDNIIFPATSFGVGVNPVFENELHLNIYPNPVSNQATIDIETPASDYKYTLCVYNTSGQLILQRDMQMTDCTNLTLDTKHWTPGIYFVRLSNLQNAVQQRVLKL